MKIIIIPLEKWKYVSNKQYKVKRDKLKIYKESPVGTTEIELWAYNPVKVKTEPFGETKVHKIYRLLKTHNNSLKQGPPNSGGPLA